MPGTIQVSVLDFMPLQSSSAPLQVSVKVSMGKREYNTSDKGEFSFPLTTLRDNLVVALQDAEGNEISNTGIETRLVIEKGVWDDIFPLRGGGHVHMKLQFLLSEDDRQRIRNMRESALRKKHETPNRVLEGPQHNSTAGTNVALHSKPSSEASESQKSFLQDELVTDQAGIASMSRLTLTNKGKIGPENIERSRPDQMQNNTDRREDAEALSPRFNVLSKDVTPMRAVDKTGTVESLLDVPFAEEPPCSGIVGSVVSPKIEVAETLNEDQANGPNKQSSLNKTPNNVRKMITAFESSLNQNMKPQRRPASTGSLSTKPRVEADLYSSQLNELRSRTKKNIPVRSLSGKFRNLFHTDEEMQNGTACIQDNKEQSDFIRTLSATSSEYTEKSELRAERLPNREKYVYFKNNFTAKDHKVSTEKEKMYAGKKVGGSTSERASASGRTLNEHSSVYGNFSSRKGQGSNLHVKKSATGTHIKGSQNYNIRGASRDNNYRLESSGGWIFPDGGGKRLCLSAGGKKIINLMGDLCSDEESQTRKMNFSGEESTKKCNVPGATQLDPKGSEEIPQRPRKINCGNPTDSETSTGPLGQVMKVAIMVGFATLVLFTRQRNTDR